MIWLLHLVQRGGDWAKPQPVQVPPCCTNGPLLCGFNMPIKGSKKELRGVYSDTTQLNSTELNCTQLDSVGNS